MGQPGRTTNGGFHISPCETARSIFASNIGPQANLFFPRSRTIRWNQTSGWAAITCIAVQFGWMAEGRHRDAPRRGQDPCIAVSSRNARHSRDWTGKGHIRRVVDTAARMSPHLNTPRNGWVTSIAFDPLDDNVLYATYGNFGGAHVFRSIDGGVTWQSLDGSGATGLPDIPVHSIVVDPDDRQRLYLGTDLGVMVSIDGGHTWMTEETGFGPAVTMWLSLIRTPAGQKQLFAFTHGRGACGSRFAEVRGACGARVRRCGGCEGAWVRRCVSTYYPGGCRRHRLWTASTPTAPTS